MKVPADGIVLSSIVGIRLPAKVGKPTLKGRDKCTMFITRRLIFSSSLLLANYHVVCMEEFALPLENF